MQSLKYTAVLMALMGQDQANATASPNPGSFTTDNTLSSSEVYDCLQKGNYICRQLSDSTNTCVTSGGDAKLTSSSYLCTNKFTDSIMAHSIANIAESGTCPTNQVGEKAEARGTIEFPHGKQKCSVMISAKCGGPAFQINNANSIRANDDYEIYWAEWDSHMVETPTDYLDTTSSALAATMAPSKRWPRYDQTFEYTSLGSEYYAGYPGNDGTCQNYFGINCWINAPDQWADFARLRALKYGLGQPSSGKYDITAGGWKTFGGQGQKINGRIPAGWRPSKWQSCGERLMLIVVINKATTFQDITSKVVLDIAVAPLQEGALFKSILMPAIAIGTVLSSLF